MEKWFVLTSRLQINIFRGVFTNFSGAVTVTLVLLIGHCSSNIVGPSCDRHFDAESGWFSSPNFPRSYHANTHCQYLISTTNDAHIQLKFTNFSLFPHSYRYNNTDYVEVYDGGSASAKLLGRFVDATPPLSWLVSSSNKMFVVFRTDSRLEDRGFNATYEVKTCPVTRLRNRRGRIDNPGYPQSSSVPFCSDWFISDIRKNSIITISFDDLDLPSTNLTSCTDNYVLIGPVPELKFCGGIYNGQPRRYISERNHVWIKYRYSANRAGRGFSLEYVTGPVDERSCLEDEFMCQSGGCILSKWQCNGAYECNDSSDELHCPSITSLTTPSSVHYQCQSDQTGCDANGGYHCLLASQWCDGHSDCDNGLDEDPITCSHQCSESYDSAVGHLLSPQYPALYPPGARCEYMLHVALGHIIQLRVVTFSLAPTTDTLFVYNGADSNTPLLGRYDNRHKPAALVESAGNRLFLLFITDGVDQDTGFNISYQQKGICLSGQLMCGFGESDCYISSGHCDGVWQCRQRGGDERGCRQCPSDMYPCGLAIKRCYHEAERCNGYADCTGSDDEDHCSSILCGSHNGTFLCNNGRCIYEAWQCDGAPDCTDGSDEINCPVNPSTNVITAAAVGSIVCALLIVLALASARRLSYLRQHSIYGSRPPLQEQDLIFAQLSAPPLYDVAMVTSRPYDEVMQNRRQQQQQLQQQHQAETVVRVEQLIEATTDAGEAEGPAVHDDDDDESVSLTLQEGVQWRRQSSKEDSDNQVVTAADKPDEHSNEASSGNTVDSSTADSISAASIEEQQDDDDEAQLVASSDR